MGTPAERAGPRVGLQGRWGRRSGPLGFIIRHPELWRKEKKGGLQDGNGGADGWVTQDRGQVGCAGVQGSRDREQGKVGWGEEGGGGLKGGGGKLWGVEREEEQGKGAEQARVAGKEG